MKVARRLLPIKLHYFFFMAASGPMLPYLTVYGKELGISEVVMGSITAVLPILFLMAKPLVGFIADYFRHQRKLIFMLLISSMSTFYVSLYFVPPVPYQGLKTLVIDNATLPECNTSTIIDHKEAVALNCTTLGGTRCQFSAHKNPETKLLCITEGSNCTLESDEEIKCHFTEDGFKFYKSFAFYGFVTFMSLAMIAYNVCNSISDAICFDILGDDGTDLYGKQRVWGAAGFGITALIAGFGMDFFSGTNVKNYTPAFILVLFFTLIDLLCCYRLELPKMTSSGNILGDVGKLLKRKKIIIFLGFTTLAGFLDSFIISFLFWYLEDLSIETNQTDNIKMLEGLTVAAQTLGGEILFFPLSGKILNKIGYNYTFTICFFNYALRLGLISLIPSPWWIVSTELFMQGPTYALTYTVIVAYANDISPPGTSATMQGLVAGMDDGLGYAIGSLIGGFLYRVAGGRLAFQYYSLLSLIGCIAHLIVHKIYFGDDRNEDDFPTEKYTLKKNYDTEKLRMGEITKLQP